MGERGPYMSAYNHSVFRMSMFLKLQFALRPGGGMTLRPIVRSENLGEIAFHKTKDLEENF